MFGQISVERHRQENSTISQSDALRNASDIAPMGRGSETHFLSVFLHFCAFCVFGQDSNGGSPHYPIENLALASLRILRAPRDIVDEETESRSDPGDSVEPHLEYDERSRTETRSGCGARSLGASAEIQPNSGCGKPSKRA